MKCSTYLFAAGETVRVTQTTYGAAPNFVRSLDGKRGEWVRTSALVSL